MEYRKCIRNRKPFMLSIRFFPIIILLCLLYIIAVIVNIIIKNRIDNLCIRSTDFHDFTIRKELSFNNELFIKELKFHLHKEATLKQQTFGKQFRQTLFHHETTEEELKARFLDWQEAEHSRIFLLLNKFLILNNTEKIVIISNLDFNDFSLFFEAFCKYGISAGWEKNILDTLLLLEKMILYRFKTYSFLVIAKCQILFFNSMEVWFSALGKGSDAYDKVYAIQEFLRDANDVLLNSYLIYINYFYCMPFSPWSISNFTRFQNVNSIINMAIKLNDCLWKKKVDICNLKINNSKYLTSIDDARTLLSVYQKLYNYCCCKYITLYCSFLESNRILSGYAPYKGVNTLHSRLLSFYFPVNTNTFSNGASFSFIREITSGEN